MKHWYVYQLKGHMGETEEISVCFGNKNTHTPVVGFESSNKLIIRDFSRPTISGAKMERLSIKNDLKKARLIAQTLNFNKIKPL